MADESKSSKANREDGVAPAIPDAADGNESRLTKGYSDNPDAPDAAVAQVENLKDE